MTQLPSLQHDCKACSALCCVVFPFDAEQGFGFDKEALTPCSHLKQDFTCGIHQELDAKGFRGCIHYSCNGAGQRVTRVFGEVNWRNDAAKANEVYAMFSKMQRLHALLSLLQTAISAVRNELWIARLSRQQGVIESLCLLLEKQENVDEAAAARETHFLLKQLSTEPAIISLKGI